MRTASHTAVTAILAVVFLGGATAQGIIRVDLPLGDLYKKSKEVLISRIDSVDASAKTAALVETVTLAELGKKVLSNRDRALTLHLPDAKLAEQLRQGAPVVIFVGQKGGAAVHLADGWHKAEPADKGFSITGPYEIAATFPGTTPSLVRALLKLRAGEAPMVDAVMHHTWSNDFKLQTLDVKALAMASADTDGDHKADLVVLVEDGSVRFYRGSGPAKAFTEATKGSGLESAKARRAALADANGDGKPDLLLDKLYLNTGSGFAPSKAGIDVPANDVLAVALMDAGGDGKPDALVLTSDGVLTVYKNPGKDEAWTKEAPKTLWKPSPDDKELAAHIGDWGDDGTPHAMVIRASGVMRYSMSGEAADYKRLTGADQPVMRGGPRFFPMEGFVASAAWDRNGGDGNLDLLIATKRGKPYDLELVGRGHGAFLFNTEGGVAIAQKDAGGRMRPRTPKTVALAPADMYGDGSFEMLVLEEDGTLWQKDSPVYISGTPISGPKAK
jgi:hypothetical protein